MDNTELIQFRIDAFTPDTLPMSRLAEYLTQLADLLGSHEHVHFLNVKKGSAVPQAKVDYPAIPKVQARLQLAHTVDAPDDIRRPFEAINRLLKADNAKATLKAGNVVIGPGGAIAGKAGSVGPAHVGCPFSNRCPIADDKCRRDNPALQLLTPVRAAACWRLDVAASPVASGSI